ncbi:MAG: GNAT family N-acetyltransferase [Prevotellaceae bacterium]|jgi:diamine N-acetyltransferase|nr:GNAT family N-acetyltransferase [Prevotellaceae bacterium]
MKLENPTVKLRAVEPADVELLYLWENDPETWVAGESIAPCSRFELEKYVLSEGDIFANRQLRLMIDDNRSETPATVGAVDLFDFNPAHNRAGVGILIYSRLHRQKGYATAALEILIEYASTALNLHLLYCNIRADNKPSLDCFKKAGFEVCGVKKSWNSSPNGRVDEIMMQLLLTSV